MARPLSLEQRRALHAKVASRGRMGRFLARHPGVRQSLRRAAVVGAAGTGLALLGARNARLGRQAMGALAHLRLTRAPLATIFPAAKRSRGVQYLFRGLEHRARELKTGARARRRSSRRLAYGAAALSFPAGLWVGMPAGAAIGDAHHRRVQSQSPPTLVVRRRRRAA